MTGARCAGHILQEGKRRGAKWGVVTMCIGGGQGAAGLFEIYRSRAATTAAVTNRRGARPRRTGGGPA